MIVIVRGDMLKIQEASLEKGKCDIAVFLKISRNTIVYLCIFASCNNADVDQCFLFWVLLHRFQRNFTFGITGRDYHWSLVADIQNRGIGENR